MKTLRPSALIGSILCSACMDVTPPAFPDRPELPASVRVGIGDLAVRPISQVRPRLPDEARRRGISGPAVLEIRIGETGDVSVLRALRGDPLLVEAAVDAVRRWQYEPVSFEGRLIPLVVTVLVDFDGS